MWTFGGLNTHNSAPRLLRKHKQTMQAKIKNIKSKWLQNVTTEIQNKENCLGHLPESCNSLLLDDGFVAVPSLGLQRWISFPLLTSEPSPHIHRFCLDWFLDTTTILSQSLDICKVVARNKNHTNGHSGQKEHDTIVFMEISAYGFPLHSKSNFFLCPRNYSFLLSS